VLTYADFGLILTTEPGGIPFKNSRFMYFLLKMQYGGKKLPSPLQQAITLIVSPFSLEIREETFLDLAPAICTY
jgi:hypothetical protein